jgi:hypothetical protein
MNPYDKSFINILPASINSIFCYFNFSAAYIKKFEEINETTTWTTSKTMLKLFYIDNGIPMEKQSILIHSLADNWYITLTENDVDLFVEIGKLTKVNKYIPLLASNILSIPRASQINSPNIYMMDINNSNYIDKDLYNTEILKPDKSLKDYDKFEAYINKKHCDLSSSK